MLRTATLLGCCLVGAQAFAADHSLYVGAGATQSDYGLANPGGARPFDDQSGGFKLIAGWRPHDNFGVEATYVDHGHASVPSGIVCMQFITEPCPASTQLAAETLSAFAIGYLDLRHFDLFAKAGITSWTFDGHSIQGSVPLFRIDEDGTDFAWGMGVQKGFRSIGLRLEFEQFNYVRDESLDTISLAVTWNFR